jgi:glycosyltransferase involved in cell wall biosynthesis
MNAMKRAFMPIRAIWSKNDYDDIIQIIRKVKPDVVHFHNVFPLISPSAYAACKSQDMPVVQTLHHYRIVCPGALLFRENAVCTECSGMHFLPGIKHGCYRNSRIFTTGMVAIVLFHKLIRTWQNSVDLYIALSEFALGKYKELGFPSTNFYVKQNFLQNPISPDYSDNGYGIYMGRIGKEKGMDCLLLALRNCPTVNFKIIGDGPLREHLKTKISEWGLHNVEYLGVRDHAQCMQLLIGSRFHVLPSQWYEGIPMVLLEAMSAGKPSIVSDIGVLPMMVKNGVDGLVFQPGSVAELADKLTWMNEHSADARGMGKKARLFFEQNYMKERNYQMLMDAYQKAIELHQDKNQKQ